MRRSLLIAGFAAAVAGSWIFAATGGRRAAKARAAPRTASTCKKAGCRWNAKQWKCICRKRGRRGPTGRRLGTSRGGPMVKIPASCHSRGTNKRGAVPNRKPRHTVCLSAFSINKYEVTLGQYLRCVKANACKPPAAYNPDRWNLKQCNYRRPGSSWRHHPVNCVTWTQADAFCKWAGRRLSTEAEWEYAAVGSGSRRYPWGDQKSNMCKYAVVRGPGAGNTGCGKKSTWPVGSRPAGASPFGVMDMVGNVVEWTQDCYDHKAYAMCGARCKDPVHPCAPRNKRRSVRGSSFSSHPLQADPRWRRGSHRGIFGWGLGFRCAKSGN